jgi:maleate isomerase
MTDKPDVLGGRLKIGVVVPSTNTVVQPEIARFQLPGITCHTGRIPTVQKDISGAKDYLDHIALMRAGIKGAISSVLDCGPGHIIMSVALEAFWDGVEGAASLQADLSDHAGCGVTIGSSAVRAALEAFGAKNVAVLTPHLPAGNEHIKTYLEEAGFNVLRLKGLDCKSPFAIARVSEAEIKENLLALNGEDVDALVQLGTNLAGGAVSVEVEQAISKPVIAINPATYWHALRQNGIKDRLAGHGELMARH